MPTISAWYPGAVQHGCELLEPLPDTAGQLWYARHNDERVILKRVVAGSPEHRALDWLLQRGLQSPRLIAIRALHDQMAVMEDGGQSLHRLLRSAEGAALSDGDRVALVTAVFEALRDLHDLGITHGDLKPLNVLVAPNDRADVRGAWRLRLIDFGLSTQHGNDRDELAHTLAGTAALAGTPFYLDPALADGRPRGPRSDLFAAGIIAFELLVGRRPSFGDPLPMWLERCIGHYDSRYHSAAEVLQALSYLPDVASTLRPLAGGWDARLGHTGGQSPGARTGPTRSAATVADDDARHDALLDRLRRFALDHRGQPPSSGYTFLAFTRQLYDEGLGSGISVDGLARLLERAAEDVRERDAQRRADLPAGARVPGPMPASGSPQVLASLAAQRGVITAVRFLPDGVTLVTGSSDQTLRLWRLDSPFDTWRLQPVAAAHGHWNWVRGIDLSADGTRLVSASDDGTARVWQIAAGNRNLTAVGTLHGSGKVRAVAVQAEGNLAITASTDGVARLWRLTASRFAGHVGADSVLDGHSDVLNDVALSADGRWALTGSDDGDAILWDVRGRGVLPWPVALFDAHSDRVTRVAFSADSRCAITGGSDAAVRLWRLPSGETPMPRMIAGEGELPVPAVLVLEHESLAVTALALSTAGDRLAVGLDDGRVVLWEVLTQATVTATQLAELDGHTDGVTSLAFSPDGALLASAAWDHSLRVWSLPVR